MALIDTSRHEVTLTRGFYPGKSEVTQAQYAAIMGKEQGKSAKGPDHPVNGIPWFIIFLSRPFMSRVSICALHLRSFTFICGCISSFPALKTATKQEAIRITRNPTMFAPLARTLALILLTFPMQPAWAQDAAVPKPGGHLFILSGQSNMTGGLKQGFADTITKELGEDQVTIVLSARAGRGIRFWTADYALPEGHPQHGELKGGNGEEFTRLVGAVKDACDARTFKTVTFIWMQGESDAMRDLGAAYERSFTTLVGNLKKELGIGEIRFVIGRISDHGLHGDKAEGWKKIRAIQQKIAEDDPLGGWIDTDDLNGGDETMPQGDLHYPQGQAVTLGERFARAALGQLQAKGKAGDMPTAGSPLKVLFIGNSLTFYNDLPGMVKHLAGRAAPPLPVEVESVTIAGASLKKHWEDGEALKAIRRGGWDCVVLQGHSMEAVTDREGFFKHVRLFDAGIKQGGANTMLYMTWALRKAPQDQQGLTEAYHEIGKETGARVVPVGVARESLLKLKPDAPIYHRDGKHPTPQGTYLAACLFHAMLSGRSPAGLPAEVPDAANPEKALVLLNPEDAALYQDIAGKAAKAMTGK